MNSPPETERTGPREEAGPTITSTEPDDTASDDWRARLAEQRAEWLRRRDAEQADRAERRVRRNHGLAARHAAKARRGQ